MTLNGAMAVILRYFSFRRALRKVVEDMTYYFHHIPKLSATET